MEKEEINAILRRSWSLAVSDRAGLARLFYSKLFKLAPETEALFETDLAAQGRKLVATLSFIIDNLDDPDSLLPAAEELAKRHVDYNVQPNQYRFVGEALIETLRDLIGPQFDQKTEDAWAKTYQGLSQHMIQTAYADRSSYTDV